MDSRGHPSRFLEIKLRACVPIMAGGHHPIAIFVQRQWVKNCRVELDHQASLTDPKRRVPRAMAGMTAVTYSVVDSRSMA